jgi:hypothetical protein
MSASSKFEADRTRRVQVAAVAALGLALLVAAVLGTYQASLARAHAVREAAPAGSPSAVQYLPGASGQIGALREPLMVARREALRAGFDRDEAPIDAFDRLRSIPGHDEEARSLLAQFWDRRAMHAEGPVDRALYALQARVVYDDDTRRRTADSAIGSLGPLLMARHVAEGTILGADARTMVVQGVGWLHVLNVDTSTSFDLPVSEGGSARVDGNRMVAWGAGTARLWTLDGAPEAPEYTLALLPNEVPLAFSGASPPAGCVVTSAGRVWRVGDRTEVLGATPAHWFAASIDPACERVVLRGDLGGQGIASYHRRAKGWVAEPLRSSKGAKGFPIAKSGEVHVEACASQAPRCVLLDPLGVGSIWDFSTSPPKRLFEGIACEAKRFSPDGKRLACRESQNGVAFYTEGDDGEWTRTDAMLPRMTSPFLENDGTICGSVPWNDPGSLDRADVLFLAPQPCGAPSAVERSWSSIRVMPTGSGAVFTFPATGQGASGNAEFYGFDGKGESLAGASNAWFGDRRDQRLLERDTTNSAAEKLYELDGTPFDPTLAIGDPDHVSSVQIEHAYFVQSPEPSLVFDATYVSGFPWAANPPQRAVARWDLPGKHFCGAALPGSIQSIAPTGDAVVIDGRIYKVGACSSETGFEPTDVTGVVAVGPGANRWIAREGDTLLLHGSQHEAPVALSVLPRTDKDDDAQLAFSPNGSAFLVRTAGGLCDWTIAEDGVDLEGCRWSTGGWASDAAWSSSDRSGETVVVFDRTAQGAVLRDFFGARDRVHDPEVRTGPGADLACNDRPRAGDPPLASLQKWEERLGHRFKDQGPTLEDARERISTELVPTDTPLR